MNLPCYLILQQVKEDIGNKELVLEKINLKLADALGEENDKRASYKDFMGNIFYFQLYSHLRVIWL
jgi:hypothetical protein